VVQLHGTPTTECPGNPKAPAATSGNLCLYVSTNDHTTVALFDPALEGGALNEAGPWGAVVNPFTEATAPGVAYGTWAVTA
jgi:hypothetical protein